MNSLEGTDHVALINSYLLLLLVLGIDISVKAIRKSVKIKNRSCSNSYIKSNKNCYI